MRTQEDGWQEPYESRGSRTDLRGTGGEIPPVYPAKRFGDIYFTIKTAEIDSIIDVLT